MTDAHRELTRMLAPPKGIRAKGKIKKTLSEFKAGSLHGGSKRGPIVRDKSQALAIALEQGRRG